MSSCLHVRQPSFLPGLTKLEFSLQIFGKLQISNFEKIRPVGAKLFHADERTDVLKLIVLFSISRTCLKTSQLMLYREIIVACSQIHTKHINTLCGQNVELLFVKPGGA
jgi:hypothetical protein